MQWAVRVISRDAHNSQLQAFKSRDARLWQYNAFGKQYIVVVVAMTHSCKRVMHIWSQDASHDHEPQPR